MVRHTGYQPHHLFSPTSPQVYRRDRELEDQDCNEAAAQRTANRPGALAARTEDVSDAAQEA